MVLLEVEDIAVGDYSPEYGTVAVVDDKGESVYLKFKNGTEVVRPKGAELMIDQGGRF